MKKWNKEGAQVISSIYFKELSQMTLIFSHFFSVQFVCLDSF